MHPRTHRLYRVTPTARYHCTSHGHGVRAFFWRGGTSNGLMIRGTDLPVWNELSASDKLNTKHVESVLQPFFRAAMGSPDPYGRQLNGMGGGISSLSKAVIVEKSHSSGVDADYMFVQIGIKDGKLDLAGNCGNMSSAVAPFVVASGILEDEVMQSLVDEKGMSYLRGGSSDETFRSSSLTMRLRNMNTGKRLAAQIQVGRSGTGRWAFEERGNYVLNGVPGYASPIALSFLDPAGSKTGKAMPTGQPTDVLWVAGKDIEASLLDISNPGIFIDGREVGWNPAFKPEEVTANTALMDHLEAIRREGATRMGMNSNTPSIPKIVLLAPPTSEDVDITCQALSMEQAHKAVPVTLALNLGVASKLRGTLPFKFSRRRDPENTIIGHPSGSIEVGAEIEADVIKGAKLMRTARCLMEGYVNDTSDDEWVVSSR